MVRKADLDEHVGTRWPVKLVGASVECVEMLETEHGTCLRAAVGRALPTTVRTRAVTGSTFWPNVAAFRKLIAENMQA